MGGWLEPPLISAVLYQRIPDVLQCPDSGKYKEIWFIIDSENTLDDFKQHKPITVKPKEKVKTKLTSKKEYLTDILKQRR